MNSDYRKGLNIIYLNHEEHFSNNMCQENNEKLTLNNKNYYTQCFMTDFFRIRENKFYFKMLLSLKLSDFRQTND